MAQMIQQRAPRRPHAATSGPLARAGAAGWKDAGSEASFWERSTEGEGATASPDRGGPDGEEEPASGSPSERSHDWCEDQERYDQERCTEESWYDDSEDEEDEDEAAEAGNPFDEELASAEEPG